MKSVIKRGQSRREPLYLQVEDALRRTIAGMTSGERLMPERALAGRFGVSLITVREAIRILASEGRLERIQGRGTFVRKADESAAGQVALLIHHNISSPRTSSFYLRLAQEIRELLDDEKIPSRLYISRRASGLDQFDFHCPEFVQDMEAGKIRGIIGVLLAANAVPALPTNGIPIVGFGAKKHYSINGDTRQFFTSAVEELLRRGKCRLGLMTWGGFESDRSGLADIFREVLKDAGLPVVEPWIKDDIYPTLEGSGWGAFREIWSAIPEHPDGLIIADDFFLPGTALAIGEADIKVPDQLEIVALLSDRSMIEYPFPIIDGSSMSPPLPKPLLKRKFNCCGVKSLHSPYSIFLPPIYWMLVSRANKFFTNRKIHPTNQFAFSK